MRLILPIFLIFALSACTPKGSQIDDGFLGGIYLSTSRTTLSVSNSTVASGGTVTVTLFVRDQNGNPFYVPNSNPVVAFAASGGTSTGTFSSVTNHHDGTYTATFTGGAAGTATALSATVDGASVPSTASVQVLSTLSSFSITSATVTAGSSIHLVWGSSTGATSYTVKYGTSSGSYPTVFSASATSPLDITGLTPGTTYYVMVTAVNGSGSVDANAEASATAMGAFTMTSVAPATGAAAVSWGAATGATSYDILYDTSSHAGGGSYASSSTGVASGASITGLSAGTTYYFRVRANGASGSVLSTNELSSAVYQNFTLNIPFTFGTDASYTISDTSRVELTGGVCRLKPSDQTDSDGTASHFGGATMTGVQWDSTNNYVRLNTTTNNAELDPSWTPQWSSLVGYWKLNSNANDSSTYANHGSLINGSGGSGIYSTTTKAVGTASFFTSGQEACGSNATISVPDAAHIKQSVLKTFSAWLRKEGDSTYAGGYAYPLRKGSIAGTDTVAFAVYNGSPGVLKFLISKPSMTSTITADASIYNGLWTHVVGVIEPTSIKIYVNGSLVSSTAISELPNDSTVNLGIGSNINCQGFNGYVDEVALWNQPLTSTEVALLFNRQSAKYSGQLTSRVMDGLAIGQTWTTLSSTSTLPFYKELPGSSGSESSANYSSQSASLMNGIVGLWHLNEATGATSAVDASGNSKNGIPNVVTFGASGILRSSAQFNGSSSYIYIGNLSSLLTNAGISASAWVAPYSSAGTGTPRIVSSWNSSSYSLILSSTNNATTMRCMITTSSGSAIATSTTTLNVPYQWYHVACIWDGSVVHIYVNGVDQNTASLGGSLTNLTSPFLIGGDYSAGDYWWGAIDEVTIWNRGLSAAEVLELYRRGANRVKHQIRSCSASDCSDQDALATKGWKGPDNTNQTYFSELYNTTSNALGGAVSTGSPTMTFSNFSGSGLSVTANRYFQYRTILESDDANSLCNYGSGATACSPELQSVSVGPTHYDTTVQTITSKASIGSAYQSLDVNGFTETLGAGSCSAGAKYALSPDGTSFYYWNGSAWAASSDYTTASDGATIRSNLSSFPGTAGTGTLQIKTFLKSTGTSACEVDNLQFTGKKY